MQELTGRSAMRSPGKPSLRREVERGFGGEIAKGVSSEEAAVGVSQAVGSRWFRQGGGMATVELAPLSGRYLSFGEREEIAVLRAEGLGVRAIARRLGRSPSTISRELRRNAATRGGKLEYRASVAQWKAELVARRPKTAELVENDRLRDYVAERLSGEVRRPDGTPAAGPAAAEWKGRNKPYRADRRWVRGWSPQQISNRLRVEFPDDESMRISHEAIYQALYVQGRGALKRELVACLRTGRALRVPRARTRNKAWAHVTPELMLSERPAEAGDRAVPGHWEGDLVIGLQRSAIGTLVERTTRFTMLTPPAPRRRLRRHRPHQERPRPGRLRRRSHERRARSIDDHPARAAAPIIDLGPRQRTLRPRGVHRRDRHTGLLLRPPQPLAARHQREHQRAAAPILPQRHRPVPLDRARPPSRRPHPQHPAAQNPRLAHTRRSPQRTPTLPPTTRCCDNRLNPPSSRRGRSPSERSTQGSCRRWDRSATASTTR